MSPSIREKKSRVTSQGHVVKKRPCYPSVGVCVVLCVSPIVSRSCESSGSSCWQGVTPTRRANVQPAQAFRDVRLFVQEATSVRVCCICGPILPRSRHLAFVTSCNPLRLSLVTPIGPSASRHRGGPRHIAWAMRTQERAPGLCEYIRHSESITSYIWRKRLNTPDILPRGNHIHQLTFV